MHPLHFLGELSVVEPPDVIVEQRTHRIVGNADVGSFMSEEMFEGSDKGGFGSDGRCRVEIRGGRRAEEERRESEER